MKHKFAKLFLLGAARALECTDTDDCSVTVYGMGACCLIEEEHWGTDNVYTSQLCRTTQEMKFYSNSIGWN